VPIVGTAGHVDHGKSTLVQALTGRDPDRWAEEKERGLTIDLGFAWTEINGIDIGFVDVPGHERFIKNMLAGVGAIDCAMLVVAADSGWMPQTEEHATVLDLLDTTVGVIALSRIDLVDADTVELATLEIMEEALGTVLEGWPIVPVSPITGEGMDALRDQLSAAVTRDKLPVDLPLKMWVDRSFTVSGAGVVVTGTIAQGEASVGDEVEILPEGGRDKIRGLHHHDEPVTHAQYGSRTAVNLQNGQVGKTGRGSLVCRPGSIRVSDQLIALTTPARSLDEIPGRGAFHFHIGTAHSPATIRQLYGTAAYLVNLDHGLPMAMGDRFILRDSGRQAVVGGGQILEPHPTGSATEEEISLLSSSVTASPDDKATALLAVRGTSDLDVLQAASGGGVPEAGLRSGSIVLSPAVADRTMADATTFIAQYHRRFPLRPGVQKAELASQIGSNLGLVDAMVASTTELAEENGYVRTRGFSNQRTPDDAARWSTVKSSFEESFDVPRMSAINLDEELLHSLIRDGELIQIGPDLVFTSGQINSIQGRIGDLREGFSVSEFRDEFSMTRRQAVPMLEWLDKSGWTRRSGDGRTARRQP
jgi:selenocysteine-specific elongation factor